MSDMRELPPAISPKEFQALSEMVGQDMPEILADILETYLIEAKDLMASVATLKVAENSVETVRAVHSLKSSSASLGAMRLSDLCAELENYSRGLGGDLDVVQQVDEIQAEFARVCMVLEAEKERLDVT